MDFNAGSSVGRRWAELLAASGQLHGRHWAGSHGRRHWTTQAARNLLIQHGRQLADARALVRDRASQFIDAFDEIFRTEGMKILPTPVRTPVANAFAERWIGTLRRELLDRTIIWNRRQLNKLVVDYIDHYNMRVRIRVGSTVHSISYHPSLPTLQTSQIDTSKS